MILTKLQSLALASILIIGANAFSQQKKVLFGVRSFIGISTGITNNNPDFKGLGSFSPSYGLEVTLSKSINKSMLFDVGIGFDQFGDRSIFRGPDLSLGIFNSHRFRTTFYALSMPLGISIAILPSINFNTSIVGSYLFRDKLELMFNAEELDFFELDAKRLKFWDIRPRFGVTCVKSIGEMKKILLGIEYKFGLIKNASNIEIFENKLPNRSFTQVNLTFGIQF